MKKLKIIIISVFFIFSVPVFCTSMTTAQAKVHRENFVSMAKQKVGSPYVLGAVGPNTFDCSGLIYFCAREAANKQLPRTAKALYSYCRIVKDSDKEVGDLLFFKTTASGNILTLVFTLEIVSLFRQLVMDLTLELLFLL